jgi:transposase
LLTDAKLLELQHLARQSIGTKERARVQGLVFEQEQLMTELALIVQHLEQLEAQMMRVVEGSREGQILTSIPPIGPIQAATIIIHIMTQVSHLAHSSLIFCMDIQCNQHRQIRTVALGPLDEINCIRQ